MTLSGLRSARQQRNFDSWGKLRLHPCRTGLPVDTCNSTPFRSACTPADTAPPVITNDASKPARFPTLSSPPGPSRYLDRVFLNNACAVINNGDTEYYNTRTSRTPNPDMFLYKPKPQSWTREWVLSVLRPSENSQTLGYFPIFGKSKLPRVWNFYNNG